MFYIYDTDFQNGILNSGGSITEDGITFAEGGHIVFEPYIGTNKDLNGDMAREYQNFAGYAAGSSIEASFVYEGSPVGLIARYNQTGYALVTFDKSFITFKTFSLGVLVQRRNPFQRSQEFIDGEEYTIKLCTDSDKYTVYVDGTFACNFIYDDPNLRTGFFGIYGDGQSTFKSFSIYSGISSKWSVAGGAAVYTNDGAYVTNYRDVDYSKMIYQDVSVTAGSDYFIRWSTNRNGYIKVIDGESEITIDTASGSGIQITPSSGSVRLCAIPYGSSTFHIEKVQFVDNQFSPVSIETYDEAVSVGDSEIKLPAKLANIVGHKFTLSVKPYHISEPDIDRAIMSLEYDESNYLFIYYGSGGKVSYKAMISGDEYTGTFEKPLVAMEYNGISINLRQNPQFTILEYTNGQEYESADLPAINISTDNILLGYSSFVECGRANAAFGRLIIDDSNYSDPDEDGENIYDYTFDGGIAEGIAGISVELDPEPKQFAPISVEYDDGTVLRRISSVDRNTGRYLNYVSEQLIYGGKKTAAVAFDNIDCTYSKPVMTFEDGTSFFGERAVGKTIYFDIEDLQNKRNTGKIVTVTYRLNDSYSVVYDNNAFKIVLHSYSGKPIKLSYEGSDIRQSPIKTTNMNPILNPNSNGFLYLTNDVCKASYLDVKVTPDSINGKTKENALVIIDAYDVNGNIVTDCEFTVRCSLGSVEPADTGSSPIALNLYAGRYVYIYSPPSDSSSAPSVIRDSITVTEKLTGLTYTRNINVYI